MNLAIVYNRTSDQTVGQTARVRGVQFVVGGTLEQVEGRLRVKPTAQREEAKEARQADQSH